ncbi:response regulator [Janthinobacterium sp. FW305-128]|uniref:response regulator n=1 Tax=Janthinobacterium sp. FW305-128 TaxID=2775055 RepID=UPI001E6540B1|nr:response regulator [Janthinobacterium sp. FW305-128]MCC7683383.1 response regulator [Janthinobacterium sp. FW305-128]
MTYHTDAAAARRQWIEWLFLLLGLLIVAAALAYAHLAEAARHDAAERERLSVLTALLAKNIEVDLEATNLVLGGVIRDYLAAGTAPDAGQALPRRLAALVDAMPGVRTMLVIDAQGKPVATNIAELADQDFSRRGYFQTARDAPDARMLYISAPFHTFKGDLVITASRMVQDKQGRFAGVVVATFAPEYFTAKFRTAMYAPDVWAVVLHGDGRQFLNYPARTANGANMDVPGSFLRRFRDSGYQAGVLSGVDIAGAPAAPRVMAMATIAPPALHMDRALIIGLSREEAAIAAPLQRQALGYVLSFAVLALAAASLLFWSQRRRRQQAAWHAEQETERQAMQAVSDSETRFRTLIEDAPVAIAILRHGRFIYSNPRYRRLHGYTADDNLNGLPWSAMISAPSLAALAANEALIEADSPSEQVFEAVGLGKQGLPVPMYKTTTRVVLKDGPATLIFAQDISTQKQAEEAMLLARDAAESANRSKAEFLANMSHEIRSPLNAILGMAWLLERDGLDGEALLMARKIRAAGQSLLGIINDVLDVSKIEAGHMTIERAPFRLADVIEKIAASMGVAAHDKPIEVRIGPLPDGVEQVMGDALRLEQVLVNLTSNAIKFTAQGAVELTSTLESRDGDAAVLCFSVRDTGIGIAPEVQEAIFSAFAQADSSTTRRFGGTGLGLTICRQLVRLMGGAMRLTSVMGQGSTFSFTVPLELMPASAPSSPDMQGLRVLLADGKADSRAAVAAVAQGLGWRVHAVSGGQAALEHALACAEDARPGVIVLAARMPDMDGEATARALREHLPPQDCPIVILAASGAPATAPARRHTDPANPADAILNEPVTASSLYNATMEARQRRAEAAGLDTGHAALGARVLAGVRVLVVDDSDINRDVVNHILCDQGALPSFACDGQQALDWLLAHPSDVDIVLMDVQMPVMDGLQATRALRQLPQFQDLPVVALTAGAFRTQRTAALEAGVNHFISKPFDVPQTIALIASAHRRHAQGLPALPPAATEAATPSRAGGAAPVIDLAQGMAQWLDEAPYRQHLSHFGNTYRNTVGAMRALLAANARGDAAALAHKLAGVAGSLALPATLQAAQQAEQLLHAGGDASAALDALEQALAHAIDAVAAFTAQTPAPGQPVMPETQHGSACQ